MATAWMYGHLRGTQKYVTVVVKQRGLKGSFNFGRCIMLIHKKEDIYQQRQNEKKKKEEKIKWREKKKKQRRSPEPVWPCVKA